MATNILATPIDAAAVDQLSAFQANLLNHAELQRQLAGVRYRLLSTLPIESGEKDSASAQPARWSALIYDYTNNRVVEASADFPSAANAAISTNSSQPLPSAEEWEEAAEIVRRDVDFSRFLLCDLLVPYRPIPALLQTPGPTRTIARTLLIVLLP